MFDGVGAFRSNVPGSPGPYADIDKASSDGLDYDSENLNGFGFSISKLGQSQSPTSMLAPSFLHTTFNPATKALRVRIDAHDPPSLFGKAPQPIGGFVATPHASLSFSDNGGVISTAVHAWEPDTSNTSTAKRSAWCNLIFLLENQGQQQPSDKGAVFKCEYADTSNCVQVMGCTESTVIGVNYLRTFRSRFSVGLEVFKSVSKGDTTGSLGFRYRHPLRQAVPRTNQDNVSIIPPSPSPSNIDVTLSVSSFGHLTATTAVPVTPMISLFSRVCFTVPPPSALRMGQKPDPPEISIGATFQPHDGSWRGRCAWTAKQSMRACFEGHITSNLLLIGSMEAPKFQGSAEGLKWGLTGLIKVK
eukprot:c8648_g1_i1.p1 GENE.c8648_g1_i1~~c8648_g1_i1.p1  ORF type:complete len:374 (+),score=61.04 c8648_g1_i1:45-1124(+)